MKNIFLFFMFSLVISFADAQEKQVTPTLVNKFKSGIGVVDMKKILGQSTAYQNLVEQFEDIRRKHRNSFTKQEDVVRDEESNILKQKNVLSKEVYAEKVKALGKKINELKSKQATEAKKFELNFEKSTNKIQGALVDVLSNIATKNKVDLVFAKSQVLLVGKEIDMTDEAIKELNKVLPKISLEN